MATGKLGSAALSGGQYQSIYAVPENYYATANILIVNRNPVNTAIVDVAITEAAVTPGDADMIEVGVVIPPGEVFERTALVLGSQEKVMVRASTDMVTVRVNGIEDGE